MNLLYTKIVNKLYTNHNKRKFYENMFVFAFFVHFSQKLDKKIVKIFC